MKVNAWVADRRGRIGRISQIHVAHRPNHYEVRFAGFYEVVPRDALRPATQEEIDSSMREVAGVSTPGPAQDAEIERNADLLRKAAGHNMPHTDYVELAKALKAEGYVIRQRTDRNK
jgi:hypothetical protein